MVLNEDDFFRVLVSHDISDLKVSKLHPLLSETISELSRERSRKSKNIFKNYWNWLLAVNHFRKNLSSLVL